MVAAGSAGAVHVVGVAFPTLVKVVLVGIGNVLHATADLHAEGIHDGHFIGHLGIQCHEGRCLHYLKDGMMPSGEPRRSIVLM